MFLVKYLFIMCRLKPVSVRTDSHISANISKNKQPKTKQIVQIL